MRRFAPWGWPGPVVGARLAHLWQFSAKEMVGEEGKCVPVAHMRPLPASCSRTCMGFRPENRVAVGKSGEVRELEANNWRESGVGACEMPGNRGRCARTSAGFVPSGREVGRNPGDVRESVAQTRGRCVRLAHMGSFRGKGDGQNQGDVRASRAYGAVLRQEDGRNREYVRGCAPKRLLAHPHLS
jgi:hypothetical protein